MALAENCRTFRVDSAGKVTGVQLGIHPVPGTEYEVYAVRLLNEYEAQGNTVARCQVLDANGINTGVPVRMAWPWNGGTSFAGSGLPGNSSNEHFIPNKYFPPSLGPLCLYVGGHNQPQSDIIFGLGLPMGHHVSFAVSFRKRSPVIVQPPIEPPTLPSELAARLTKLEAWAKGLNYRG